MIGSNPGYLLKSFLLYKSKIQTFFFQVKALPSCAALLGKAEEEEDSSDHSEAAAVAPFEMATLKSKAFKQTKKERQEEMKDIDHGLEQDTKSKRRSSLRGKK